MKRGGKLIIYHGWSDGTLSPLETVRYYQDVVRTLGGIDRTQQSVRLFSWSPGCIMAMAAPGRILSCRTLPWPLGPTRVAPDHTIATHYQNNDPTVPGIVTRTMPLCPYPGSGCVYRWRCQRGGQLRLPTPCRTNPRLPAQRSEEIVAGLPSDRQFLIFIGTGHDLD